MARTALLFPGQGAQQVGMGQALVERCDAAKALFEQASSILGYDLLEICLNGPSEKLNETRHSQPALFVHSLATLTELQTTRPEILSNIVATAGLSLGEYTAIVAAGGMTFADGLKLVQRRADSMQAAADLVNSGMASVIGLTVPETEAICEKSRLPGEVLQVANLLCPGNIAVSGHAHSLAAFREEAAAAGARMVIPLSVAGAFHTSVMQPAVQPLSTAIAATAFSKTTVVVYSNVDAKPHTEPSMFAQLLAKQVVSPVLWEDSLRAMLADGIEQFYEIGIGRVLAGTMKRIERKAAFESIGE